MLWSPALRFDRLVSPYEMNSPHNSISRSEKLRRLLYSLLERRFHNCPRVLGWHLKEQVAHENNYWHLAICAVLVITSISVSYTQTSKNKSSPTTARESDITRGKYLVEEVAKCAECHTPRDAQNQLDSARWLQGAPIWITSVKPDPQWADRAPTLAGFPGYSDEDGASILEKGIGANGEAIRPPMHIYHLKHERRPFAIIAYLRSLPSTPK